MMQNFLILRTQRIYIFLKQWRYTLQKMRVGTSCNVVHQHHIIVMEQTMQFSEVAQLMLADAMHYIDTSADCWNEPLQ